jgi:hypothetical protein
VTAGRVPIWVSVGLAVLLVAQVSAHLGTPLPQAHGTDLRAAPTAATLRAAGLDERIPLAKFMILYLQAFDNQPGISIPFRELDYTRVESWLARALELDPNGQYPLLAASRLYAEVASVPRQRLMLDFVYREFAKDPNRRWPWLAHGVIVAKHRLNDPRLALKFAAALREQASGNQVPGWAKQMEIFLREDVNELESAKALLGGLLASGQVTDPHEWHFLKGKLEELENKSQASAKQ